MTLLGCAILLIPACGPEENPEPRPGVGIGPIVGMAGSEMAGNSTAGNEEGGNEVESGETVDPPPGGMMAMGGDVAGGESYPPMTRRECNEVEPNADTFANVVGPNLVTNCGFCHGPNGTLFQLPISQAEFTGTLEEPLLSESISAVMDYVVVGKPEESTILSKAYNVYAFGDVYFANDSAEYEVFSIWILEMI
jgi:hypothetical protein